MVEDDDSVRRLLVALLEDDGYEVRSEADGVSALAAAREFRPELALLDGGLPGLMDGGEVARRLRSSAEIGIIFVTGAGAPHDVDAGFRAGGDDYVVKPFEGEELLHRVRAVLRRLSPGPVVVRAGDLVIDEGVGQASIGGAPLPLTATEFKLLMTLVRSRSRVMNKDQLLNEVWSYGYDPHVVEVHIKRLRDKLGAAGPCIRTVPRPGLRLRGVGRPHRPPEHPIAGIVRKS